MKNCRGSSTVCKISDVIVNIRKEEGALAKGCVPKVDCKGQFLDQSPKETARSGSGGLMEPENVHLKLRPNSKLEFKFKAKKDQNAIDIYFLLDLSGSMNNYKKLLEDVPDKLIPEIKKKTDEYSFGFGVFREKAIEPFSSSTERRPAFQHYQNLTNDTSTLKE